MFDYRCRMSMLLAAAFSAATAQPISTRYMEFPNAAPGATFKVEKYLDEATGRIKTRINGAERVVEELQAWQSLEEKSRAAKRGNLAESVHEKRHRMGKGEKLKVVIHRKYPEFRYPDKTRVGKSVQIESSRAAANLRPLLSQERLSERYGLAACSQAGGGSAVCEVTRDQLDSLQWDASVGSVEEIGEDEPAGVGLYTLPRSAFYPNSIPATAGQGVRAATFDEGLRASFLSCAGLTATYDPSIGIAERDHAEAVFWTLAQMAPGATLFSHRTIKYDTNFSIDYILDNRIQTVSMSWSRGKSAPYPPTRHEFLVMDDFAYRYPYPVFVNPAFNLGYEYEVNWQCYNAISVGNVRHTDFSTYEMAGCTQAKNPPPVYGSCIAGSGSSCAGDREMPHVVAPGFPNRDKYWETTCLDPAANLTCGTSYSAPIVNGLAADLISMDARLTSWPEKIRAIIMLLAQNVDGGHWSRTVDGRDGTGVITAAESMAFAQIYSEVMPNNSPVEMGVTAGSMYATDFSGQYKRFYIQAPTTMIPGRHLRVVLTWDSNPVVEGNANVLSDLDLVVQTNGGQLVSSRWDSNVEVIDAAATDHTAGGTYYIDVAPYTFRTPPAGARTNYFYYSMAWAWVKDHAP